MAASAPSPRRVPLSELAAACHGTLDGDPGLRVADVTHDSRSVRRGSLFVAVPGHRHDGLEFLEQALKAGACAVASEAQRTEDAPRVAWIRVGDAREALADLAYGFWGHPDRDLALIGVTGTNGKTSTAWILERALTASDRPTALLGSILYRFGEEREPASRTTPEAPVTGRWLRTAADGGAWGAVMEVSSHGIELERVRGLAYRAAVFTNLEPEHLDFHGDIESYFAAKARLFRDGLLPAGLAVCNADDPRGSAMAEAAGERPTILFGRSDAADLRITRWEPAAEGTRLELRGMAAIDLTSPLVGPFAAMNLAAAAATLLGLGLAEAEIAEGLAAVRGVPGRMERVATARPYTVLVDYAHTPEALASLMGAARELAEGRVIVVFGCGGERDTAKRAPMGRAAARGADVVVLTDDNPRGEDPEAIRSEILRGARDAGAEIHVEADRRRALALALELARAGDVVVAAGKGDERYQEIAGRKEPWHERAVLEALLGIGGGGGAS